MELPSEVPVMTLPNAILFPQALLPLYIFEPRYRRMLRETLDTHRMFSVAMQRPGYSRERPSAVAGLGLIRASVGREDGTSNLVLQGITRVELIDVVRTRPYRIHRIRPLASRITDSVIVDALTAKVLELVADRLPKEAPGAEPLPGNLPAGDIPRPENRSATVHSLEILASLKNPEHVADLVSWTLLRDPLQRQTLLETLNLEERLRRLIQFLIAESGRARDN